MLLFFPLSPPSPSLPPCLSLFPKRNGIFANTSSIPALNLDVRKPVHFLWVPYSLFLSFCLFLSLSLSLVLLSYKLLPARAHICVGHVLVTMRMYVSCVLARINARYD